MPAPSPPQGVTTPAAIVSALADLRLDAGEAERIVPLGTAPEPGSALQPGSRYARVHEAAPAAAWSRLDEVARELAPAGALLLHVSGAPDDRTLARWRNALWPLLHVALLYRISPAGLTRQTLAGRERIPGDAGGTGVLLVGRRRAHVMSPDVTVEKFDLNASAWNGEPGAPGYPHFRWMRRFVARFSGNRDARRILDFGCGAGWVGIEAALRRPTAELCAFDPSPEMVRITETNARAEGIVRFTGRTGFGEDPPFPAEGEAPFELVLSSGVVSFAPDVECWLDGVARAVAPGGTLVIGDIHRDSRGMRARRRSRPLLPVREMNAQVRADIRAALAQRGFAHERSAGYQLTFPLPQALHFNETRLEGAATWPLLLVNRIAAAVDAALGSPAQDQFDSWVMRLRKR